MRPDRMQIVFVQIRTPHAFSPERKIASGNVADAIDVSALCGRRNGNSGTTGTGTPKRRRMTGKWIKYKQWIPVQWPPDTNSQNCNTAGHYKLPGTGCFESEFSQRGMLHGFGIDAEETANGVLHRTAAIVEKKDGTVELMPVSCIQIIGTCHP